jgi:hypothetical protein
MAPQAQSAAPRPAAAPTYYGPHASPYAAATGNADAGYAAFDRIRNAPDSGFAYDALRNDRNAQTELYLGNANASTSFDNWMRRNTDTFYNRYVADSAQANNPSMQFSDWMHQQNLGAEFLQQSPENRGYFQGIASPAARWVV